jgi:hypothetical protein
VHWLAMKSLRTYGQCFHVDDDIQAAVRGGDWLISEFAPIVDGNNPLYEISTSTLSWLDEMAELYAITKDRKYLDFAASAMEHCALFQQMRGTGRAPNTHAYNLMTYLGGAVRIAQAREDQETLDWLARVWDDIANNHLFPTASMTLGEGLGTPPCDVPEGTLQETCATVEWIFFTQRLYTATGDVRYKNMLERTIRNALLGAQKADGMGWTYFTPLRSRKRWLHGGTECCFFSGPRGVARLPRLVYGTEADAIRIELFESSLARFDIRGHAVTLVQDSAYPAEGSVSLQMEMDQPVTFGLKIRVPEHTQSHQVAINGEPRQDAIVPGEYLTLSRTWKPGDTVELRFQLEVWLSHLRDGSAAIMRGVQVLAADERDNDIDFEDVRIAEPIVLEDASSTAGERPRYGVQLVKSGVPTRIVLTPFAEAGNPSATAPDAEVRFRTAFPARPPQTKTGRFCGARGDVDGRLAGPGITYRECEIVVDAWDATGGHGAICEKLGGAPFRNHGTLEMRLSKPCPPDSYGGIRYNLYGEGVYGQTVGFFLGHKTVMVARWPDFSPGGKTAPTWCDQFPCDPPQRTKLRLVFGEEDVLILYHNGSAWVQAATYPLNNVHGEDWADASKFTAMPYLLSLGSSVSFDEISWEGPLMRDFNLSESCCSPPEASNNARQASE